MGAIVGMISLSLLAGVPVRQKAVRHVARRTAAGVFLAGASEISHAPRQHLDVDRVVAIPAGIWDIDTFADLSNIGTLFAFIVVSAGVLILRKTQPDRKRSFRVPGCPFFPILSIVFCLVLMMGLPLETWIRFFVWLFIGLAIYYTFGRKHSRLREAT